MPSTVTRPGIGPHQPPCDGYLAHVRRATERTPESWFAPSDFNELVLLSYNEERLLADHMRPDFDFQPYGDTEGVAA